MYALQNNRNLYNFAYRNVPFGGSAVYGGNFLGWLRRTGRRLFDRIKPNIKKAAPALVPALMGDQKAREELRSIGKDTLKQLGRETVDIGKEESKRLADRIRERLMRRNQVAQEDQQAQALGGNSSVSLDRLIEERTTSYGSSKGNAMKIDTPGGMITSSHSSYGEPTYDGKIPIKRRGGGIRLALSGVNNREYARKNPVGIHKQTTLMPTKTVNEKRANITQLSKYGGAKKKPGRPKKTSTKTTSKKSGKLTPEEFIASSKTLKFM